MESGGWVQKPMRHETRDLTHTHWCGDDVRTVGPERVPCSTADTPKENLSGSREQGRGRHPSHPQWCETPKLTKKEVSLCRCLLTFKSRTGVKTGASGTPGRGDAYTLGASQSPDVPLSGPLSYSMPRSDVATVSCMKRRLVFSQAVTSTLEGERDEESPPLSEPDLDESIISGLLPSETPEMPQSRHGLWTHLVTDLSESMSVLSTPSHTPLSRLDTSEDSGFGALRLDGLEDGGDGSFQEGAPRVTEGREHHRSRLERQRRLSTLREGSQSEDEVKVRRVNGRGLKLEVEVFAETLPLRTTQHDLSLTPALQAMEAPSRKMDVLTELHMRNLHHVLSSILQVLSAKDIYTCTQVCDSWSDIILQDSKANRRRRMYEREQKRALEMAWLIVWMMYGRG